MDAIVRAGVYRVEDPAAPVSLMCDRAVIAQRTVKGSYFDRVATYDPGMRAALIREREVVALVLRGNNVPAIARKLYISENTTRDHMKSIYRKAAVHSRQELIDLGERTARELSGGA